MEKASIIDFQPLPTGDQQYPLEYIEKNLIIKLREDTEAVSVGVCDPANIGPLESLKNFHDKQVFFFAIDKNELAGYLGRKLSEVGGDGNNNNENADLLLLDKLANDAPIVNLVNSIFIEAIRAGASDIHIESFYSRTVVRYRTDGYLHTVNEIAKERFPAVATRIKIMANLNIMERRLPQDGRMTVHLGSDMLDVRVSIIPIKDGESIVLRLFNQKKEPLGLGQLGLADHQVEMLKRLARSASGLVLVTGPTGSGKTTTLNAVLNHINSDDQKIVTIEDPIEYVVEGVSQIQTNERIGLTFDSILRRVLRQDPNIIMVGEIRDLPTAELAVRAALTGHLVLSTLHTRDSVSAVSRLRDLGVELYLIAAVLKGAVAQRLVRRVCDDCRKEAPLSGTEKQLLELNQIESGNFSRGRGCKLCNQTGFRGRIGVFEMFEVTDEVGQMIVDGKRETELRSHLKSHGMIPLVVDGLIKAGEGTTTISDVEKATLV